MKHYDYILLGNGAAALSAAEAIRSLDEKGSLLMMGEEALPPYSRPLLSKTPLAGYDRKALFLKAEDWYRRQEIELLTESRVRGLDVQKKCVESSKGSFSYGKLIYALGASPFVPPIPGSNGPHVHVLRSHADILRLKRRALPGGRCVIIGGGVIGLEAAFALSRYGVSPTVLEALPMLMPRFLDRESAERVEAAIQSFPVHSGVEIRSIEREYEVDTHHRQEEKAEDGETHFLVQLKDGRSFPCDFVLMATGVRANSQVAQEAGVECGRGGVRIDACCQSSAEDVYACGDCAEYKLNYQLWSQALAQGRVAGINAAGGQARLGPIDSSLILNSPELALFSCGDVGMQEGVDYRVETEESGPEKGFAVNPHYTRGYEKRFYREDRLVGAILLGHLGKMQEYKEEILGILPGEVDRG